jgi:hypothetical protein
MAFTITSTPAGQIIRLQRATANQPLGTIGANLQAVNFVVSGIQNSSLKRLVLSVNGTLSATNVLECSIDGGTTWFLVPALTSDVTVSGTTDTAAVYVFRYDVSGLTGALFRFGATTYVSGSGTVFGMTD